MEEKPEFELLRTSELVDQAKEACHIITPNDQMTDEEIRTVMRWIGQRTPDTEWVDGKFVFGRMGIELMLFMTLSEFPDFYVRYELSQFN